MSEDGVGEYVQSLRGAGSVDSQGVFTIGWEKAVEKLRTFQAGDPEAFLLYLVSAGCAYGARNISIEDNERQLTVTMHATYVHEGDIGRGFQGIAEGKVDNDALDLGMGLHGGLREGVGVVELAACHPQHPCYRWQLTPHSQKAVPEPAAYSGEARVTVTFQRISDSFSPRGLWERLFGKRDQAGKLGGYAGMSRPCQIVDSRCDRSAVPISINSQLVTRPLHLPRSPVAAVCGTLRGIHFQSTRVLQLEPRGWQGGLVYHAGPLSLVVNGISYPALDHPSVSGTVWTTLNRDLSRQRIVEDELFQGLMRDLDQVARRMAAEEDALLSAEPLEPLQAEEPTDFPHLA